ncbi:MAG: protein-tyrosine phosphatase family protein [Thermoanaerobaculia bacterium]
MPPPLPIPESYWVIPGLLLAGEYPFSLVEDDGRERLRAFLDAGIRLFVDLTEPRESGRLGALEPYAAALLEEAAVRGVAVRVVRHAVKDMGVPRDGSLERIVEELEEAVARGEPAYVHCWGGIGRTGTAVAAFLSRRFELTGDEALDLLDRLWQEVPKSAIFPESPQTNEQRRAVRAFAERPGPRTPEGPDGTA